MPERKKEPAPRKPAKRVRKPKPGPVGDAYADSYGPRHGSPEWSPVLWPLVLHREGTQLVAVRHAGSRFEVVDGRGKWIFAGEAIWEDQGAGRAMLTSAGDYPRRFDLRLPEGHESARAGNQPEFPA